MVIENRGYLVPGTQRQTAAILPFVFQRINIPCSCCARLSCMVPGIERGSWFITGTTSGYCFYSESVSWLGSFFPQITMQVHFHNTRGLCPSLLVRRHRKWHIVLMEPSLYRTRLRRLLKFVFLLVEFVSGT